MVNDSPRFVTPVNVFSIPVNVFSKNTPSVNAQMAGYQVLESRYSYSYPRHCGGSPPSVAVTAEKSARMLWCFPVDIALPILSRATSSLH